MTIILLLAFIAMALPGNQYCISFHQNPGNLFFLFPSKKVEIKIFKGDDCTMKFKKILAGLLSATIIFSLGTSLALNQEDALNGNTAGQITTTSAEPNEQQKIRYKAFTGIVKEIREREGMEDSKLVSVESKDGNPADIVITCDTYILEDAEISIGDTITAYYDATRPMIMIYPPQYSAEVVVVESSERNVKFDIFNEGLASSDNQLKLNISDETEIFLQDGTTYEGELTGKRLIVIYGSATKSIPAQTTPYQIIVLFDMEEEKPGEVAVEEKQAYDVSTMEIIVENKKIEAPAAYESNQGVVMVPLRAIAEALGYEVVWNNETQSVMVGKDIFLTIGKDGYTVGEDIIKLGAAPELTEERTFVPLSFFKNVMKMNNAYVFEGQIVIDNEEVMQ